MTDRELLELSAKAAGIELRWHPDGTAYSDSRCKDYWGVWNPLADEGDALRLAATLCIDLEWRTDGRVAAYRHATANGHCFTAVESSREDRAANSRRAIVRAAAEIGRSWIAP